MLGVRVTDSKGREAIVIDNGVVVTPNAAPAPIDMQVVSPLAKVMSLNNDGVTFDLTVDGSVDNMVAFIEAEEGFDIYVKQVSILVEANQGGSGIQLNMFGNIVGGLTNGLIPFFEDRGVRLAVSERPLITNFDLIRIGSLSPDIGADDTAFRIKSGKTNNAYGYHARWDTTQLSAGTEGFALKAGSKQKFGMIIRDDLTGLDTFEIFVVGYRRSVK